VAFRICDKFKIFQNSYENAILHQEKFRPSEEKFRIPVIIRTLSLKLEGKLQPELSGDHPFRSVDSRSIQKSMRGVSPVPPLQGLELKLEAEKSAKEDTMASRTYANTHDYERTTQVGFDMNSVREFQLASGSFF
jgi:hypothetical protein